jgi:adenosylcobyric acid synthase
MSHFVGPERGEFGLNDNPPMSSKAKNGPAQCVMVLGTTSGAGKSWLATALCRWYARQGLKVAPFKAQNMSNNARVVGGGEIGSAQYFQALAARAVPDVRMNPLLLKPERDTHSQVVLLGQVNEELSALPWRGRSERVWPQIAQALDELRAENDVVVIEGAGSPAEINLMASDIVNMRIARMRRRAACWSPTSTAAAPSPTCTAPGRCCRGRPGAAARLRAEQVSRRCPRCWRPRRSNCRTDRRAHRGGPADVVAARPAGGRRRVRRPQPRGGGLACAVTVTVAVAYPRISNLDEFQPLKNVPGVRLRWARTPADVAGADWIVLPGSKHTSGDLAWLRAQGLDRAVAAHAERGGAVLGICGGLQMLGEALVDPHGIDGNAPGLGLLPLVTQFAREKTVRHRAARFGELNGAWAALSAWPCGLRDPPRPDRRSTRRWRRTAQAVMPDGLAWQNARGNVLGIYLHGLFEDPGVLQALFGAATPTLDATFDGLADFIDTHFDAGVLAGPDRMTDTTLTIPDIADAALAARLQHALDNKTKPLGALGRLEALALRIGTILGSEQPVLEAPQMLVCAGDHGLAARGVSAYPSDVTWQMVENFLAGGAAVSVLARQHGLALTVVDCGVRRDFQPRPGLVSRRIAEGTADASAGPAMTRRNAPRPSPTAARWCARCRATRCCWARWASATARRRRCCWRGSAARTWTPASAPAPGSMRPASRASARCCARCSPCTRRATSPLDALAAFGGFEIATLVGAVLQAAEERRVIVLDGFIASSAVLVAQALQPHVVQRCVAAHCSAEPGHALLLAHLGLSPLLSLDLRLGEGSGAALAWPLLESACRILREMASFEAAGVSRKDA